MSLELEISATGQMTVRVQEAPVPAKRGAAKKVAARKAAPKKATREEGDAAVPRRDGRGPTRCAAPCPSSSSRPSREMSRNRTVTRLYRKAAGLPGR